LGSSLTPSSSSSPSENVFVLSLRGVCQNEYSHIKTHKTKEGCLLQVGQCKDMSAEGRLLSGVCRFWNALPFLTFSTDQINFHLPLNILIF